MSKNQDGPTPAQIRRNNFEDQSKRLNKFAESVMLDGGLDWYVGFSLSGDELKAQKALCINSLVTYVPLIGRYRRLNRFVRRKQRAIYPAVAGLMFIGVVNGLDGLNQLMRSDCIYGILSRNGEPISLDPKRIHKFINDNRAEFIAKKIERHMNSNMEFKIGDTVEILDGSFQGQVAPVSEIVGGKAKMEVSIFGGVHNATVSLDKLAKIA